VYQLDTGAFLLSSFEVGLAGMMIALIMRHFPIPSARPPFPWSRPVAR
jgi:hypothetical protein